MEEKRDKGVKNKKNSKNVSSSKTSTYSNVGEFFKKKIFPLASVCVVASIIIVILATVYSIDSIKSLNCTTMYCSDSPSFWELVKDKVLLLGLTLVMSILTIPYLPYLGLLGYMCGEAINISYAISVYGFGATIYIVPLIINIIVISVITSIAIYLSKISWYKSKVRRKSNMNLTNFRLQVYQIVKNEKKYNELNEKYDKKNEQYENKIEKVNWKKVGIICGTMLVLQIISSVIELIVL